MSASSTERWSPSTKTTWIYFFIGSSLRKKPAEHSMTSPSLTRSCKSDTEWLFSLRWSRWCSEANCWASEVLAGAPKTKYHTGGTFTLASYISVIYNRRFIHQTPHRKRCISKPLWTHIITSKRTHTSIVPTLIAEIDSSSWRRTSLSVWLEGNLLLLVGKVLGLTSVKRLLLMLDFGRWIGEIGVVGQMGGRLVVSRGVGLWVIWLVIVWSVEG